MFLSLKTIRFIFNSDFIVTPPRPIHTLTINRNKFQKDVIFFSILLVFEGAYFKGALYNRSFLVAFKNYAYYRGGGGAYYWKRLLSELYGSPICFLFLFLLDVPIVHYCALRRRDAAVTSGHAPSLGETTSMKKY